MFMDVTKALKTAKQKLEEIEIERRKTQKIVEILENADAEMIDILASMFTSSEAPAKRGRKPKAESDKAEAAIVSAEIQESAAPRRGRRPKQAKTVEVAKRGRKQGSGRRYPRILEDDLRVAVVKMLTVAGESLSAKEIIGKLVESEEFSAHENNKSFSTRVYSMLGDWSEDGKIRKVSRGVYQAL